MIAVAREAKLGDRSTKQEHASDETTTPSPLTGRFKDLSKIPEEKKRKTKTNRAFTYQKIVHEHKLAPVKKAPTTITMIAKQWFPWSESTKTLNTCIAKSIDSEIYCLTL